MHAYDFQAVQARKTGTGTGVGFFAIALPHADAPRGCQGLEEFDRHISGVGQD